MSDATSPNKREVVVFLQQPDETALNLPATYEVGSYVELFDAVNAELNLIDMVVVIGEPIDEFRVVLFTTDWKPLLATDWIQFKPIQVSVIEEETKTWEEAYAEIATNVNAEAQKNNILNLPSETPEAQ